MRNNDHDRSAAAAPQPSAGEAQELDLTGEATNAFVEEALDQLRAILAVSTSATDEDRLLFSLAVSEILTNVVLHGAAHASVEVRFRVDSSALSATITDSSPGAHIDWASVSMPDEHAEHGRGLALARAALDALDHQPARGSNTWRLLRRVGAAGAAP